MRRRVVRVRSVIGAIAVASLVAAGLVGTGALGSSAAAADPTPPSTITLSSSTPVIAAGDSATLTADTDVAVDGTGESIQITDQTTSAVLATCATGTECTATTTFYTGDAHTYAATVGDLTSSTVSVEREAWTLHLASSTHTVKAGMSTNVVAKANQDVGQTDGNYEIDIFDIETGTRIAQCATGTSCTAPSTLMYDDDSFSHNYSAVVATVGTPASPTDATDVQASAGPVTVSDAQWHLTMTTNRDVVAVGQTVTVTLHANQNVAFTNGQLELYIFDPENNLFLASCDSATTCITRVPWVDMFEGSEFVGMVAAAGDTTGIDAVTNVQGVASYSVPTEGWTLGLTTDQTQLAAGETVNVSSVTNQNVGETSGRYVQYIFDAITDTVLKTCVTGTVCDVPDHLYKTGEAPYVGFDFISSVAAPGATNLENRVDLRATSDAVEVDSAPWTLSIEATGVNQFTVTSNQDVGKTGGQFGIYLYDADDYEIVDHCFSGTSCILTSPYYSDKGFFALVVSRSDPEDELDTLTGVGYLYTPDLPKGPDLPGETTSGSNPAEGACACQYGDPVDSANGDFVESDTDLSIPGVGPAFQIGRSYDSGNSFFDGPFGFGWSPSFGATLKPTIAGTDSNPLPLQIQVVQENGSTVLFTRHGASTYVALKRVHATLAFDATNSIWSFARRGMETLTFNAAYQLLATQDSNDNQVALTYDSSDHVTTITTTGGRTFTITWTGSHVTSVEDSADRTVTYGYNGSGELVSVIDPDDNETTYGYDAFHEVTSVTGPRGGTTTNHYNSVGQVTSQRDPLGRVTSFDYSLDEASYGSQPVETTTVTSPDGSKVRDVYTDGVLTSSTVAYGTSSHETTTYTYNSEDERTKVVSPSGHTTTYSYDTNGNVLEIRDPLGHKTLNTYDAYNDLLTSTNPLGVATVYTYDAAHNLSTQTIDPGPIQRETQWGYFPNGTIESTTNPLGKVTTFTYNSAGQQLTEIDPDNRKTTTVYDAAGRVTSVALPGNRATTYTFDSDGNQLTVTTPDHDTTTSTYDADGNLTQSTNPDHEATTNTFDLADEKTATTDAANHTTHYAYAKNGNVATTTDPDGDVSKNTYNSSGELSSAEDADNHKTTYHYDPEGALSAEYLPSGDKITAAYDAAGRETSWTDALGHKTTYAYNAGDELTSSTDPDDRTTTGTYTPFGELSTITHPGGSSETTVYDKDGNKSSFTNADGDETTYSYDAADLQTGETKPGGIHTSQTYNLAGESYVTTNPDASTTTTLYTLDGLVKNVHSNVAGSTDIAYQYGADDQLTKMTDQTGSTTYAYDVTGTLKSETNGHGDTLGYVYDPAGRLQSITYPGSKVVSYAYDPDGNMSSVQDWNANTTAFTWTANGQLATQSDPDGTVQTNTYNKNGQALSITDALGSTALASYGYGYDDAGQVTSQSTTDPIESAQSATLTYSSRGQLASSTTGGATNNYTSSAAGELLSNNAADALQYNTADQLDEYDASDGTVANYDYTPNGARSTSTVAASGSNPPLETAYTYDPEGNLASATLPTTSVSYKTDGAGLRESRTQSATTTHYLWDTQAALPALLDDGTASYIYGPGASPIAQIDDSTGAVEYLHDDGLGSTRLITDSSGAIQGTYEYNAYGAATSHSGTATSAIGFSGNWTDATTGLIYLRARDYDPATGQFLSIDPAFDTSNQAYAYAADDPISATDPTGLLCFFGTIGGGPCQDGEIWGEIGNFALSLIPGVNLGIALSNEYQAVNEDCPESTIINLAWDSLGAAAYTAAAVAGPVGELSAAVDDLASATNAGIAEAAAEESGAATRSLYHYTSESGQTGILDSQEIRPSLRAANPNDARHGDGQYFSDIAPGTYSNASLSKRFLNIQYQGARFSHFVEVDLTGVNVIEGRPGVFVVPNQTALSIFGRVLGWGTN